MASPSPSDQPQPQLQQTSSRPSLATQLGALIVIAAIFGGGGVAYGFANLMVQLSALAILAFNRESALAFWRKEPRWLGALVLLTLAIPILHLVPLPPAAWQSLPGRELAAEARQLVGADGWYPLTLDGGRTLVAATGLIAPLAMLMLGVRLSKTDLARLGWLIVALGFVQFLIGVPQVLSGGRIGLLYPENPMPGVLFGTFANRNSTGLFLLACVVLASLLPLREARLKPLRWVLVATLVIALILTRSRSAVLLLAIPLCLVSAQAFATGGGTGWFGSRRAIMALIALLASVTAALAIIPQTRLAETFQRFSQTEDARLFLWEDAQYAATKYWPVGAGMGTFDEVFQADESLEHITARPAGRAHNDYLELAMEAGAPGLVLALAWIILVCWLVWRARSSENRWQGWSGAAILGGIALQSLFDYPLRSQAMLCLAAFAFALLYRHAFPKEARR